MNDIIDRVPPGFFESDEDGCWMATDEAGPDGNALGITFSLYVQYPEDQLAHCEVDLGIGELSDEEQQAFVPWVQSEYPDCDWCFDADVYAEASFYGEYLPGESTDDLSMRICVYNPAYNRVRNEGTIFYHMLERFVEHVKTTRDEE